MKRILGVLTFCMLISMTACNSSGAADSATDETSVATVETTAATEGTTAELTEAPTEEITTEPSASVTLTEICNWATADIWNNGFCDISHYIEDGKSSVGQTMDIEFTISILSVALEKKEKYNDYIMSLDSSSAEIEQLQNAWSKMFEQIDVLYNRVVEETPRPADATYEFDTGLFKQYYDAFYDLCRKSGEQNSQSFTIDVTEIASEVLGSDTSISVIDQNISSSNEYVEEIGKTIAIDNITAMLAQMIGAVDGTSFYYNGNKFEIYQFADGAAELEEAASGQFITRIEGFGDITSFSAVNGNYIMIYTVDDPTVKQAFLEVTL